MSINTSTYAHIDEYCYVYKMTMLFSIDSAMYLIGIL